MRQNWLTPLMLMINGMIVLGCEPIVELGLQELEHGFGM